MLNNNLIDTELCDIFSKHDLKIKTNKH